MHVLAEPASANLFNFMELPYFGFRAERVLARIIAVG
jgi:hypothetical protein